MQTRSWYMQNSAKIRKLFHQSRVKYKQQSLLPCKKIWCRRLWLIAQYFYCEKNVGQIFVTLIERYLNLFPWKTKKSILVFLRYVVQGNVCKKYWKTPGAGMQVCDLVVAGARYHPVCRSNFKNQLPKQKSGGCPSSTGKLKAETQHTNDYSVKMTKIKLKWNIKNKYNMFPDVEKAISY